MKKLKNLLLIISIVLLSSCSNDSGSSGGGSSYNKLQEFPENNYYFQIPSGTDAIEFPEVHNQKECYLVYTNEKFEGLNIEEDGVLFDDDTENSRSAESTQEMVIYKNAFKLGNNLYRDEVHFNISDIKSFGKSINRNEGTASNTGSTNNNTDRHDFFAATTNSNRIDSSTTSFEKKAEGHKCRIWYQAKTGINFSDDTIFKNLAKSIDFFYEKVTQVFGSNNFSDPSGLFISADENTILEVLVYDLYGDAEDKQESGTFGFFNPFDFVLNAAVPAINENSKEKHIPNSNEAQVIHIDSHFLLKAPDAVMSTAVHEFQHLLNFCNKAQNYNSWYTEMLSMCAEDIFQGLLNLDDLDSPKSRFNEKFNSPWKGFLTWPKSTDPDVYFAYANAYAFGAYLMRNYGGIKLIHEIATNNYVDEQSVTRALQALGYNETFYSALKKFSFIYIFPENKNYYSLNKSISQTISGSSYTLTPINLNDYAFKIYNSKSELDNFMKNNLYPYQKYGTNESKTLFGVLGPMIYKKDYSFTDSINPYGFIVFYLGTVDSDQIYEITHKTNLTMTLVVKD